MREQQRTRGFKGLRREGEFGRFGASKMVLRDWSSRLPRPTVDFRNGPFGDAVDPKAKHEAPSLYAIT